MELKQLIIFLLLAACAASSLGSEIQEETNSQRISEKKCFEYREVYRKIRRGRFPGQKDRREGLECPDFSSGFIVGGRNALHEEFPHMASLQYKRNDGSEEFVHACGGTLISEQFILTAAHCTHVGLSALGHRKQPDKVLLGDITVNQKTSRKSRMVLNISEVIVHPDYNDSRNSYNDIALIKLEEPLTFPLIDSRRPPIRPACLAQPGQDLSIEGTATAIGWGDTMEDLDPPNILQAVNITILDSDECTVTYADEVEGFLLRYPEGIEPKLMCAGAENKDTCFGDSGGPLTVKPLSELSCMDFLIGVTSGGSTSCGTGIPGVFVRVESYIDWIEKIVWKDS